MYEVLFRAEVVTNQEFNLLNREQQRDMLRVLEQSPRQQKPLRRELQGCYRYRCSDVRVVFSVNDQAETVTIIHIGRRRDDEVYAEASRRL